MLLVNYFIQMSGWTGYCFSCTSFSLYYFLMKNRAWLNTYLLNFQFCFPLQKWYTRLHGFIHYSRMVSQSINTIILKRLWEIFSSMKIFQVTLCSCTYYYFFFFDRTPSSITKWTTCKVIFPISSLFFFLKSIWMSLLYSQSPRW